MMVAESSMHRIERELLEGLHAGEARMFEDPDSGEPRRRHPRRRSCGHLRRKRHADRDYGDVAEEAGSLDDALLSDEERHYRAARRRAEQKVELSRKAFRAAIITLPLLIFLPFAGVIALVVFGIDLGRRAFRLFYEPRLRERFMNEEIQRRVQTHVVRERESLEGEQHRSLEQLSASIAHEIRNPITAAKSLVQQMGEHPDDADLAEYARVAVTELERVERSISHLLRFAREEETRTRPIVMEEVVE
ncbi:MAG: HAMP domain-containing histidine kinase [Deltaproteobacteria bacterium]|jgi:signal transduction histidine kinase|nr:HAMP domain-containing histidine kinase [Deltaproteobacteria bacterium]